MNEWWKQRYVQRRDWIIENLAKFSLSAEELMTILVIDYMNEYNEVISHDTLGDRMNLAKDKVDEILSNLKTKGYLNLSANEKGVTFNIDGVFTSFEYENISSFDQNIFELFECEFKRTLSQHELQMLSEWMRVHELTLINYALREALTYEKLSFDYINAILARWKSENIGVKEYEAGRR